MDIPKIKDKEITCNDCAYFNDNHAYCGWWEYELGFYEIKIACYYFHSKKE